jgi:oxaloacetate decarboxylase alpha subunit/pyruvate carboxylase subunit B
MIVKNLVNVGDAVKAGDPVIVLEAMKMENNLGAPCDGTVKALNFGTGDSVAKDTVLAVIG